MATIAERQHFPNHSNFTVKINGTNIIVTVTTSASVIDEWIDTTFIRGADYVRRRILVIGLSIDLDVNTLHLCAGDRCLIIQLYRADSIPQSLRKLFFDWVYKFGGFSNDWHRERITSSKHDLKMYKDPLELRLYNQSKI